jgi:membrane protein implicated in regulation of membrane protease activity
VLGFPETPFSQFAWVLRVALIAAVLAIIVGAPTWLEVILLIFVVAMGLWSLREGRKRRQAREEQPRRGAS